MTAALTLGTPRERPILFSGPMVRAILAGEKSQTRRIVKPDAVHACGWMAGPWKKADGAFVPPVEWSWGSRGVGKHDPNNFFVEHRVTCPYGVPGDRLWVRETWADIGDPRCPRIVYRADTDGERVRVDAPWRPSIHMPRRASRLDLEVLSVRVDRLQAITDDDIRAEGITPDVVREMGCALPEDATLRDAWALGWDAINGGRLGCSWADDPWVWVVSFRRAEVLA